MDNANVERSEPSPLLKRVLAVFFTGCFVAFYADIAFFDYLSKHSPDRPEPLTGQIFSLNNHGQIFYVRKWEAFLAQPFAPIVAAMIGILLLRWRYGKDVVNAMSGGKENRIFSTVMILIIVATMIYMFS